MNLRVEPPGGPRPSRHAHPIGRVIGACSRKRIRTKLHDQMTGGAVPEPNVILLMDESCRAAWQILREFHVVPPVTVPKHHLRSIALRRAFVGWLLLGEGQFLLVGRDVHGFPLGEVPSGFPSERVSRYASRRHAASSRAPYPGSNPFSMRIPGPCRRTGTLRRTVRSRIFFTSSSGWIGDPAGERAEDDDDRQTVAELRTEEFLGYVRKSSPA